MSNVSGVLHLRGGFGITTINQMYLNCGDLYVEYLGPDFAWLDTGVREILLEATMLVKTIKKHQGYKITCLEETVWYNGWLTDEQIMQTAKAPSKNSCGQYLNELLFKH